MRPSTSRKFTLFDGIFPIAAMAIALLPLRLIITIHPRIALGSTLEIILSLAVVTDAMLCPIAWRVREVPTKVYQGRFSAQQSFSL